MSTPRVPLLVVLLLTRSALGWPRCSYAEVTKPGGTGEWGGSCICPDGGVLQVGDNNDVCGSLACIGGKSGVCQRKSGPWSNMKGNCSAPATYEPRDKNLQYCATDTVAYGFLTRDLLTFWDLWVRYFDHCQHGTAVPIMHTQELDPSKRVDLQAQLSAYGGRLVPTEDVRLGNPRWSFLMVSIIFAIFRTAGRGVGLNDCIPQWVHVLSEADVPVRPCSDVHAQLSLTPGTSYIDFDVNDGKPWGTPLRCLDPAKHTLHGLIPTIFATPVGPFWDSAPKQLRPLGKHAEWVTLATEHALALAADECTIARKFQPHMVHNGLWNFIIVKASAGGGERHVYGSPDEFIFYTVHKPISYRAPP